MTWFPCGGVGPGLESTGLKRGREFTVFLVVHPGHLEQYRKSVKELAALI